MYKQNKDKLRDSKKGSFCALGVLCDLYDNSRWKGNFYDDDLLWLPNDLAERLNSTNKVTFYKDGAVKNISWANDTGYSFNKIADFIEEIFLNEAI